MNRRNGVSAYCDDPELMDEIFHEPNTPGGAITGLVRKLRVNSVFGDPLLLKELTDEIANAVAVAADRIRGDIGRDAVMYLYDEATLEGMHQDMLDAARRSGYAETPELAIAREAYGFRSEAYHLRKYGMECARSVIACLSEIKAKIPPILAAAQADDGPALEALCDRAMQIAEEADARISHMQSVRNACADAAYRSDGKLSASRKARRDAYDALRRIADP